MEPKIKDVAGPHSKWESDLKRDQGIQSKFLLICFSDPPPSPTPFCCHSSLSPPSHESQENEDKSWAQRFCLSEDRVSIQMLDFLERELDFPLGGPAAVVLGFSKEPADVDRDTLFFM